jgi:lipoate-protein ligase A
MDTGPGGACFNMALDEAIARLTIGGGSPPTLRVYGWSLPSVTLGRFQRASDVDTALCSSEDIPVVRRPTGGRAILHGEELTYSFSAPTSGGIFAGDLFRSYSILGSAFLGAFRSLGLDAEASGRKKSSGVDRNPLCFSSTSFGEISLGGRKIIGSAQRRWPGGMLQQGTVPLDVPREMTSRIFLRAGDEVEGLMGLREADRTISYDSLKEALAMGFRDSLGVILEDAIPSREEMRLAARLEEEKYRSRKWNHLR